MNRSAVLFKAIDVFFYPFQNYKHYKGVESVKNLVYNEEFAEDCTANIYFDPKFIAEKKLPIMLNIHGGGYVMGDKDCRTSLSSRYASLGYFVLDINYRLCPKFTFPAAVRDCVDAINYLEVLAEKYNIDLSKICITGDSAGAYYATMVTAISANPELGEKLGTKELKVKPSVLMSFCGPYDLIASLKTVKLPFNLLWDIGRCLLDNDSFELKKDFSNIDEHPLLNYVSPIDFVNEKWCPAFLAMSEKDVFCKGQGELLAKKLDETGIKYDTFASKKLIDNHCFHMSFWLEISKECFAKALAFVEENI